MPLIGIYQKDTRISGPVCPNGGHFSASLSVAEEPGQIVLSLSATCINSCVTDNLEPSVGVRIIDTAGNERAQLGGELPLVPAKGWPWNRDTQRSYSNQQVLVAPLVVKRIEFELKNDAHGSPFLDFIEFAAGLVLNIIGTVGDPPRGLLGPLPSASPATAGLSHAQLVGAMDASRDDAVEAARSLGVSIRDLYDALAKEGLLRTSVYTKRR